MMASINGFTIKIAILTIFCFMQCKAYVYLLPNATNPGTRYSIVLSKSEENKFYLTFIFV